MLRLNCRAEEWKQRVSIAGTEVRDTGGSSQSGSSEDEERSVVDVV